jgi:hypothetical protein
VMEKGGLRKLRLFNSEIIDKKDSSLVFDARFYG